ncbi:MAG: DUF1592 domain-containing protein, partial [Verrucomicrobiota bacterium]
MRGHDGNHRRRLTISVKDAERLTLVVDQSDGNQGGDHANWANAYLERYPKRKASTDVEAKTLASVRPQLEPFLNTYCVRCHGPKRQKGQVRFDNVSWEIANNDVAQRWQDVLDQLNGGDMPPVDAKLPSDDDLSLVLDALTGAVIEARQRLTSHGGEIKMRRLNRREYAGTIRALFGFDVALHEIPEDGEIASFDTVGAEQFFTSAHFEKYLQLGRRVMETAFVYNTQPYREAKAERKQPEKGVEQKLRERVADFDRKMEMKVAGASWQEMGFPDEGAAKILFSQFDTRAGHGRRYLELPHFRDGAYLTDSVWAVKRVTASRHVDLRGDYLIRIRGGVVGDPDELRKVLKLTGGDGLMGTLKLSGTPDQPRMFEIATRSRMGRRQLSVQLNENMPTYTANSTRGYRQKLQGKKGVWDPWASLWVDWIEIDGPFYPEKRPRFEEILYPNEPTGGKSPYLWHDEQASELIETFTYEAFRRRVPEPEYLHGLVALYHEHRKSGMKAREAYAEVFAIVLASPGFLFLQEPQPSRSQERGIDALELANRLSYFLWSAPPDDEIFSLAKEGEIIRPEILERQLERMLADPKVEAFRDGFMSQWGEFDRFDAITVDDRDHHRFNPGVRHAAKQEVLEFFGTLLEENLPVRNLIDSDFVTINPTLAIHYDLEGVESRSSSFQKVRLPVDSPRGGMMTQSAFLMTGSNGERSSPVIRGALVMEKLLHDEPAPPPPNVPELGSADEKPRTNRDLVEMHQEQAVCASCHRKMDVIGFGLENFDTVGRWREEEPLGRKRVAIDPSGTLPDGSAFSSVQELKELLLQSEDHLAKEMVVSMLAYALGRTIEFSDADEVEALLSGL